MSTISEQEYITRIKQLERLSAGLAAEIDLARPVVEAAQSWNNCEYGSDEEEVAGMRLSEIVNAYEAAKEQERV